MSEKEKVIVVLTTCPDEGVGMQIAGALVGEGLAACVNLVSAPLESIYRWKGKVETAKEFLLVLKSSKGKLARLEREVKRIHSYELPEFLVLDITGGSEAYLKWLLGDV